MSRIGIFVGGERREHSQWEEDPSSTLRLAALTASWLGSRGHTLVVLGDAAALLAMGTSVLGQQEGRVVEGGEGRESPVRVLSLLEGEIPDVDRALGFRRRARGAPEEGERAREEEGRWAEEVFGDLSLLMDLGILDVGGQGPDVLEPYSPGRASELLGGWLAREDPDGMLALGQLPAAITEVTRSFARERRVPFGSALGEAEGSERLIGEPTPPVLDGRPLRFREGGQGVDEEGEGIHVTADEEVMQVARYGTWEAEMTYRLYQWLVEVEKEGNA